MFVDWNEYLGIWYSKYVKNGCGIWVVPDRTYSRLKLLPSQNVDFSIDLLLNLLSVTDCVFVCSFEISNPFNRIHFFMNFQIGISFQLCTAASYIYVSIKTTCVHCIEAKTKQFNWTKPFKALKYSILCIGLYCYVRVVVLSDGILSPLIYRLKCHYVENIYNYFLFRTPNPQVFL